MRACRRPTRSGAPTQRVTEQPAESFVVELSRDQSFPVEGTLGEYRQIRNAVHAVRRLAAPVVEQPRRDERRAAVAPGRRMRVVEDEPALAGPQDVAQDGDGMTAE